MTSPSISRGRCGKPEALALLRELARDLIVVAAFGQILPPDVLALPLHGCLNVHASLLPRWRGASPINAAILAGDAETGVTIMLMDAGLDTGPMLAQRATPIGDGRDGGRVERPLGAAGRRAARRDGTALAGGRDHAEPQDDAEATMTRLLQKRTAGSTGSDPRMSWRARCEPIRPGPAPSPPGRAACSRCCGRQRYLSQPRSSSLPPGACFGVAKRRCRSARVACGQGALALEVIQLEGKRAMPAAEVLRGYPALATRALGVA